MWETREETCAWDVREVMELVDHMRRAWGKCSRHVEDIWLTNVRHIRDIIGEVSVIWLWESYETQWKTSEDKPAIYVSYEKIYEGLKDLSVGERLMNKSEHRIYSYSSLQDLRQYVQMWVIRKMCLKVICWLFVSNYLSEECIIWCNFSSMKIAVPYTLCAN